jgi:hypothetical protein
MHSNPGNFSALRHCGAGLLTASLLLIAACASTPPPSSSLDAASNAIINAERANAGRFAAVELGEARDKLAQANTAAGDKDMILAERLGDEARASAELAIARTEAAAATAVNEEMKLGADALDEEMQRAGDQQ